MKVLVACEYSGIVRDAFIALGHDATSCDLLPTDSDAGPHHQGDALEFARSETWDLMVAHPPCTFLTCSAEWAYKDPPIMINGKPKNLSPDKLYGQARRDAREEAAAFFTDLWELPIPRIAIENPVGVMSRLLCKPQQIIQPFEFGDDASKKTCLWLKGLPPLIPTERVSGRIVEYPKNSGKKVERWANQTDSGQSNLPPSDDRGHKRSATYQGIAQAIATQWGALDK